MAAPLRALICLVTTSTFLLAGSPRLLQAALDRLANPPCYCTAHHNAHPGLVAELYHCHHDDEAEDTGEDDPAGSLNEDHHQCPCAPLSPRHSCGCFLVQAPVGTPPDQPWRPVLPCLAPLTPATVPPIPFVTLSDLIRPPRA